MQRHGIMLSQQSQYKRGCLGKSHNSSWQRYLCQSVKSEGGRGVDEKSLPKDGKIHFLTKLARYFRVFFTLMEL